MLRTYNLATLLSAALIGVAKAQHGDIFKFCTEGKCEECPVGLNNAGTGFPNCVIYNSKDVFSGLDFKESEGG